MRALSFYKGKKVLVTGHTGFKGTWLCKILVNAGADVTGYSLEAPTNPNLFELSGIENEIKSIIGDIRDLEHLKQVFLNVTTDKVYHNNEWEWGYRENDPLDGYDPYSNSKSCSELVTHSYINSFFKENGIAVSTARAGNVIGGGDFANDRIIPDCIRAAMKGESIIVRNPHSTRPYQHVMEPLVVYLRIAKERRIL